MSYNTQPPREEIRWTGAPPAPANSDASALTRFLGGSPAAIIVKLFVISLIVGALLMWLDIRPFEVFRAFERLFMRLWAMGFDAVREIFAYVAAGAVIVVPVWFLLRLLNMRGAR